MPSVSDETIIRVGADKVSVNSAVDRPALISELLTDWEPPRRVAIDTKRVGDDWRVLYAGQTVTNRHTVDWAREGTTGRAKYYHLQNHDGNKKGFAIDITGEVWRGVNIPVIASGGGAHVTPELFQQTKARPRWAHRCSTREISIPRQRVLNHQNIAVR